MADEAKPTPRSAAGGGSAAIAELREKDPEGSPKSSWSVAEWLLSLDVHTAVANALKVPEKDAFNSVKAMQKEELTSLLREGGMEGLAETVWAGVQSLQEQEVGSATELNEKFASESSFTMQYASLDKFFDGLASMIGYPRMIDGSLYKAMEIEHCDMSDARTPFKTSNGMTSFSREEWEFATTPQQGEIYGERNNYRQMVVKGFKPDSGANGNYDEEPSSKEAFLFKNTSGKAFIFYEGGKWHIGPDDTAANAYVSKEAPETRAALLTAGGWTLLKESELSEGEQVTVYLDELKPDKCRRPLSLEKLMEYAHNKFADLLKAEGQKPVRKEEVLGGRLYTGPMYQKYNTILRAESGMPFMVNSRDRDCKGNNYVTSIHAINSCVIKLSKLMKAIDVWRGMTRGKLPERFWRPNHIGVCGGVEYAFSSTTAERAQAEHYSEGAASTIFECAQGMVDRGADISWLSQYPYEREILYPPLLSMQNVTSRVSGRSLIIAARLNVNFMSETLDQVLEKRFGLCRNLCESIKLEIGRDLHGKHWEVIFAGTGVQLKSMQEVALELASEKLLALISHPNEPEDFNIDEKLRAGIDSALAVGEELCLQRSDFLVEVAERLGAKGETEEAAALTRAEEKLRADEKFILEITLDDLTFLRAQKDQWVAKRCGLNPPMAGTEQAFANPDAAKMDKEGWTPRVTKWNAENPDKKVTADFYLQAVNGKRGSFHELMAEIPNEKNPRLTFERGLSQEEFLVRAVEHMDRVQADGWEASGFMLARLLALNKTRTELYLKADKDAMAGKKLDEQGAKALGLALKENSSLLSLSLDKNDTMGAQGGKSIATALTTNRTLLSLYMFGTNIGQEGAEALAEALTKNSTIELLNVGKCKIGKKGGIALAKVLETNTKLHTLHVQSNGLDEEVAAAFAEGMLKSPVFEALRIQDNKLGNNGAKALAGAVADCTSFEYLDITKNGLDAEGGEALVEALEKNKNPQIQILIKKDNKLPEEFKDKLKTNERFL